MSPGQGIDLNMGPRPGMRRMPGALLPCDGSSVLLKDLAVSTVLSQDKGCRDRLTDKGAEPGGSRTTQWAKQPWAPGHCLQNAQETEELARQAGTQGQMHLQRCLFYNECWSPLGHHQAPPLLSE